MPARSLSLAACLAAACVAGCLPSSGKRQDTSLLAADSTSRALAASVVPDTLARVWRAEAPADDPLLLPTTLAWAAGRLAVTDTQAGRARWLTADGAFRGGVAFPAESYPYGAGVTGDTLGVLLRGADALVWLVPGDSLRPKGVHQVRVPAGAQAALVTGDSAVVRLGGGATGEPPELVALAADGAVRSRVPLGGPAWRSVGFLRAWGPDVVALSDYRPVVDVWASAAPDTLALAGFDSPQLRRSAQFVRGDADEPPLLIPSAAALGDDLFVLNARADELRVDVYDRGGRLRRVLVSPGPRAPLDLVAYDLAVRRAPGPGSGAGPGAVEVAVLWLRPRGVLRGAGSAVELFRWPG